MSIIWTCTIRRNNRGCLEVIILDIYELTMEKYRIVAFQIPPAIPGIPTTWNGAAGAREHESLVPLPMNKVDLIRSQ